MMEYLKYFLKYPCGSLSFDTIIKQSHRDMKVIDASIPTKKAKKTIERDAFTVVVEAKYTCMGYPPALHYWAYEIVLELQK